MKVNIPVRMKNPWFWVGIVSVAITAIGVDPADVYELVGCVGRYCFGTV
jgi:uncharacterized membrane protein